MMQTPTAIEPFSDIAQQRMAAVQGMWIFLATELLLFSGAIIPYALYRWHFGAALAAVSTHLNPWAGTFNTATLLSSSFSMALADRGAQLQRRNATLICLLITALLGVVFLAVKAHEYSAEYQKGLIPFLDKPFALANQAPEQTVLFFDLYFILTGLHAIHLLIGTGLIMTLALQCLRWTSPASLGIRVTVGALYWHFVDVIWVFLFPMFYLAR